MRVGVSGTREGCNPAQYMELQSLLQDMEELYDTLIHGDCVGVDQEAHELAKRFDFYTEIFPPTDPRLRAFCDGDFNHKPLPYLERDRAIVDASDSMLIIPEKSQKESPRSGTWYTYRYSLSKGKPTTLIVGGRFEFDNTVQMPSPEEFPLG